MTDFSTYLDLDVSKKMIAKYPGIDDRLLNDIYNTSISIRQSLCSKKGKYFEKWIADLLLDNDISFSREVPIDLDGIVVKSRSIGTQIIDFVIGNVKHGHSITNYIVISCKTSCRERWLQDGWTLRTPPIKYILCTLSKDYPSGSRFQENEFRKIISSNSKVRDDRKFKLTYQDLINEIKN